MCVLGEGRLSGCFAVFMAVLIVVTVVMPVNVLAAEGELRYELRSGAATFGNDLILNGVRQAVFHQQTLTDMDTEATSITFPGEFSLNNAGGLGVDLALPSIAETSIQSSSYTRTGFFTATRPRPHNYGAAPIGVGQFGNPSPVTPAALIGSSLLYPEMIDLGEIKNQSNTSLETDTDVYNPSITLPPPTAPGAFTIVAGTVQGMTWENVSNPLLLSEPAFNMTAPAEQINNTSMLARMWRNAHAEHLMDMAYVGDASYPSWIAPVSPIKLLQRYDLGKINRYSLNMTRPGENIIPAFWNLN